MIMSICAIYDSKAEAYLTPMYFQSTAQALRSFRDACNDDGSEFAKHPEDYTLFKLGEWDPRTGETALEATPIAVSVGIHLVESEVKVS